MTSEFARQARKLTEQICSGQDASLEMMRARDGMLYDLVKSGLRYHDIAKMVQMTSPSVQLRVKKYCQREGLPAPRGRAEPDRDDA